MTLRPGLLVRPKDQYLRLYQPYPADCPPGVLLERVRAPLASSPGSHGSWRVLWRDNKHIMFENEFEVIDG